MNSLVKNSAHLLSANVVAQVIGLVVYPILTRLYTPEDFGLLNLFLSISNVCAMVALGEYYYAIVLSKDDHQASALLQLCTMMLGVMMLLLALTIPFSTQIACLFKTPLLARYWWLIPLQVLVIGGWNILNYWYIYRSQFKRIASYQLSCSILTAGGKIGAGVIGRPGGLIFTSVIAPLVALSSSFALARKQFANIHIVPLTECKKTAVEYKNFPMYILPKGFINLLVGYFPVLLLTPLFGSYYVGLWSMALIAGFTPIYVISRTAYQIFFEHFTQSVKNNQSILPLMKRFTIWVLGCSIPMFGLLYFILPWLVSILFGADWEISGHYIRWMLPWLVVSLLTSSTGCLADIFSKQKGSLIFEIILAAARLMGICIGIYLHDFAIAIAGYCIGCAVANLAQFIWLYSLATRYERTL